MDPTYADTTLPQSRIMHVNGLMPVVSAHQLAIEDKAQAQAAQDQPVVQGLQGYVKRCWEAAYQAKRQTVEQRLLQCVRQRNGEYDPGVLADIRADGGSEIYMMITSNKCRAASSWIKDVMLSTQDAKPWGLKPTSIPDLPPEAAQQLAEQATQEAMQFEQSQGQQVTPQIMQQMVGAIKDRMTAEARTKALEYVKRMEDKMEDQFQEGGFYEALSDFIDDIVTFPYAILKGPVPRNKKVLKWVQQTEPQPAAQAMQMQAPAGKWVPQVQDQIVLEWERVDPFMAYWAPHAADVDDGFFIERHKLVREDIAALIGVEGYNDAALRAVLDEYGTGGLREWLYIDSQKAVVEGKSLSAVQGNPEATIDALQFWGNVSGKMLVDWGMDEKDVPDLAKEYPCELWQIGHWVIKASLNYDPLARKPYYKASFEEVPGGWCGNGVADLVRDCQSMCNYAARSLSNNMGLSSGPMSYINVDRLATGEEVTQLYPRRIIQTTSDPYGNTADPVKFFSAPSNAGDLMGVFEKFSLLADEYSGVPRYMSGDAGGQGALRTSSGISMLMGNAGKAIKQVIGNIDIKVTEKLVTKLYDHNMRYSDDESLKGDVQVVAMGVNLLMVKEQQQQRINEFLQLVLQSPQVAGIIGEEAVAALLREGAKKLGLDTDKIVPPDEIIRARVLQQQQQQAQQAQQQAAAAAAPQEEVTFTRDEMGQVQGAQVKVISKNGQQMPNGAAITDLFQPKRNA